MSTNRIENFVVARAEFRSPRAVPTRDLVAGDVVFDAGHFGVCVEDSGPYVLFGTGKSVVDKTYYLIGSISASDMYDFNTVVALSKCDVYQTVSDGSYLYVYCQKTSEWLRYYNNKYDGLASEVAIINYLQTDIIKPLFSENKPNTPANFWFRDADGDYWQRTENGKWFYHDEVVAAPVYSSQDTYNSLDDAVASGVLRAEPYVVCLDGVSRHVSEVARLFGEE